MIAENKKLFKIEIDYIPNTELRNKKQELLNEIRELVENIDPDLDQESFNEIITAYGHYCSREEKQDRRLFEHFRGKLEEDLINKLINYNGEYKLGRIGEVAKAALERYGSKIKQAINEIQAENGNLLK